MMSPLWFKCRNSHFTNNKLKVVCGVLDLEKKGTHSDLVDRILTFLVAPKNSGKVSRRRPRQVGLIRPHWITCSLL